MDSREKKSPKVLHVVESGGVYGAEKMLLGLASGSIALGHEVAIATLATPDMKIDALGEAAQRVGIPHESIVMKHGADLIGFSRIYDLLRDRNFDLLHSHGYKPNIFLGLRRSNQCELPIMCTLHGWTSTNRLQRLWFYETAERFLLRRMDCVVAVSQNIRNRVLSGKESMRVVCIPNGVVMRVDHKVVRQKESWCEPEWSPIDINLIIYVGRLSREKGLDILLVAMRQLIDQGHVVRLIIAGDGPQKKQLEESIKGLALEKLVKFVGYVENATDLYLAADVFALPSRTEGLPLALLEAMSFEVPVVATSVGEVSAVLCEGEFGELVTTEAPTEFANAIARILNCKQSALDRAAVGAKHVRETYSSQAMAERYSTVYRELCR